MQLVELYFQDRSKPPGHRFLGAVLMNAETSPRDIAALAKRAWSLKINPGGELIAFDLESDTLLGFTESHLDRLLTEAECLALNLFKRRS